MLKKMLLAFTVLFSFALGFFASPHPPLIYDSVAVEGFDYGDEQGTYLMKKNIVHVKRIFSPDGLLFLQEPDGTMYLMTKKSVDETVSCIVQKQHGEYYSTRVFVYRTYQRIMKFRSRMLGSISRHFVQPCLQDTVIQRRERY